MPVIDGHSRASQSWKQQLLCIGGLEDDYYASEQQTFYRQLCNGKCNSWKRAKLPMQSRAVEGYSIELSANNLYLASIDSRLQPVIMGLVWMLSSARNSKFWLLITVSNKASLQNQLQNSRASDFEESSETFDARLDDGYCSITVANHWLITVIRFVAKSYTNP